MKSIVDWSGGWRLPRNQRSAKEKFTLSLAETLQERSDEAARRSPAGKRRPERKSTAVSILQIGFLFTLDV
jgi:hypothetical protein